MTPEEHASIVDSLVSLPCEELLEILGRVFATQHPNPEEDEYHPNRYFLGTSTQVSDPATTRPVWEVQAVAYPPSSAGLGPDWGFCQFGQCRGCGSLVRSNVKRGICSVCGTDVEMT